MLCLSLLCVVLVEVVVVVVGVVVVVVAVVVVSLRPPPVTVVYDCRGAGSAYQGQAGPAYPGESWCNLPTPSAVTGPSSPVCM